MQVSHKNVLKFIDCKKSKSSIYLFIEFYNGGDLRRLLKLKGGKLTEKLARVVSKQLAKGLNYLNRQEIVHRDLKIDNVYVNFPDFKGPGLASDNYISKFNPDKDRIEIVIGDLGFAK
mmetsp:Transcript_1985/g.2500  ORF Transcript_1985/g.2500 Transcript_1985/m.2500 type:complete len:118 (+) Transcript_1985:207-560(+)